MTARRLRDRVAPFAACTVAAVPAAASGVRAVNGHWTPVIDDAVLAVGAQDASHGHPPLVGIYSSLSQAAHWPHHLYHPGPLESWVLAPFVRVLGPNGVGMAVGAAVVNAVAAIGIVWLAKRRGGAAFGWLAAAVVVGLAWSVGGQVLHDPWNPHLAIFPSLLAVLAAWAVGEGDERLVPLLIVVASFVAGLHLTFVVPMVLVVVAALAGLGLRVARSDEPRRSFVALRPWLLAGLVLGAACWIGPLIDQFAGRGNLWGLARASNTGGVPRVGFHAAFRGLVHGLSVPPMWWHADEALVRPQSEVSAAQLATAIVVVALLVFAAWRGWRRGRAGVVAGVVVLGAALFGATLTIARTPAGFGYEQLLWARRVWWPMSAVVWLVVAWAVLVELVGLHRVPRQGVLAAASGLGAGIAIVALIAVWPRLGVSQDFGSAGFQPTRQLGPATAAALHDGAWEVRSTGLFATYVVGPGLVAQLVARGRTVAVPDSVNLDLGRHHRAGARKLAGTVWVVSGANPAPPPGAQLVAHWDPSDRRGVYRSYNTTLFLVPVEPVAVYVSKGSGP